MTSQTGSEQLSDKSDIKWLPPTRVEAEGRVDIGTGTESQKLVIGVILQWSR